MENRNIHFQKLHTAVLQLCIKCYLMKLNSIADNQVSLKIEKYINIYINQIDNPIKIWTYLSLYIENNIYLISIAIINYY